MSLFNYKISIDFSQGVTSISAVELMAHKVVLSEVKTLFLLSNSSEWQNALRKI